MGIVDLFSKRQKRLRGEVPDVYRYDALPQPFRAQIVHIMAETWEVLHDHLQVPPCEVLYHEIAETLCHEYGLLDVDDFLPSEELNEPYPPLIRYFLGIRDIEKALDVVQLGFATISGASLRYSAVAVPSDWEGSAESWCAAQTTKADRAASEAVAELNYRFHEHRVGYQFESGNIIRVDSQLIHKEVVTPCLTLLSGDSYSGAQDEFLRGHQHYREGNTKEAMTECVKAFESVMKTICGKRKWKYDDRATAKTLIGVCLDHELIPPFWQDHFTSLQNLLQVGVARNKLSAHGQGAEPVEVPRHLAAFVLHMTAASILFLAEAEASGAGDE